MSSFQSPRQSSRPSVTHVRDISPFFRADFELIFWQIRATSRYIKRRALSPRGGFGVEAGDSRDKGESSNRDLFAYGGLTINFFVPIQWRIEGCCSFGLALAAKAISSFSALLPPKNQKEHGTSADFAKFLARTSSCCAHPHAKEKERASQPS